MSELITIDPITRISGFMEIRAEVEQNVIIQVQTQGLLYRGFETMLQGRSPLDAVFFTERICGICSAAHSIASSIAVENACQFIPQLNDIYIREIIHGFEYVQNHIRHFYLLMIPSFVRITSIPLVDDAFNSDFRIPEDINHRMEEHYKAGIDFSRLAHEGQAVLGGKAPHNHGIFAGGVTTILDSYKIQKVRSILMKLKDFADTVMREDADILAYYYPDYFEKGSSYPNFMSYGVFCHEEADINYICPSVMVEGVRYPLNPDLITEQIQHSWYQYGQNGDEVDLQKPDAYSFIKAPRYNGLPMEVGPLARQLISGEYQGGNSCMDRNYARMLETNKVISIMEQLINRLELIPNDLNNGPIPDEAFGAGLIDTTRGALGHWVSIKNKLIEHYNIITPSVWNLSPQDADGVPGVIEKSLLGTVINDINNPVEIGRIVRSFDPCVSCATHLYDRSGRGRVIEVPV